MCMCAHILTKIRKGIEVSESTRVLTKILSCISAFEGNLHKRFNLYIKRVFSKVVWVIIDALINILMVRYLF